MDRSTGEVLGTFTLCNNNNKMKEILPQTRHTIHLYGDKHDLFFLNFNISILKYYECSWNKPCLYPWCFYYKWRKIIWSAWIYITLGFTIILTLKVILSSSSFLLCHLSFFLFFLSAVISATWSNLVAYLWHSLTFVLVDVGEWCQRAAASGSKSC